MTAFNIHNELKYHGIWKTSAIDIFENISIKVISPVLLILLSKPCQCCLFFRINLSLLIAEQDKLPLPRTQTSLSRWKCARKGRREGDNGRDGASPAVCTLPMVPCGSSPVTRVSRSPLRWEKRSASEGGWSCLLFYKRVLSVVSVNLLGRSRTYLKDCFWLAGKTIGIVT